MISHFRGGGATMQESPEYYEEETHRDQPEEPEEEIEPTENETLDAGDRHFLGE